MKRFLPILTLVLLTSCEQAADTAATMEETIQEAVTPEVIDLSAAEAAAMFLNGELAVLDVRTPEEYETAHIEGATLVDIRGEGFDDGIAGLSHDKPFLVHCAAGVDGGRSRKAVDALKAAGASTIYHLDGGINSWIEEEHPVIEP